MQSQFCLKGKKALITGGAAGIGQSLGYALASAGAAIAVADIDEEAARKTADAIKAKHGVQTTAIRVDVTDPAQCAAMVARSADDLGGVDVCVANAGITITGVSLLDYTPEQWNKIMSVNLNGVFYTDQAAARYLVKQGTGGRIINMCSMGGTIITYHPYGASGAYCTAKGGVKQLTKAFALDLAKHRITVNCISPGYVRTALSAKFWEDPQSSGDKLRATPLGRPGEPEDLDGLAIYLASDASAYMTGSDVIIDGGFTVI
ncbi:MAG: glucose 1-dehydrogenase [Deltaproteobacteria bacterium]|nr:glucose 1-dehydrogenase [Deltaproteobacteria bacterium]